MSDDEAHVAHEVVAGGELDIDDAFDGVCVWVGDEDGGVAGGGLGFFADVFDEEGGAGASEVVLGGTEEVDGVLLDGLDARAGEDVVEGGEEEVFPGGVE